MHILTFCWYNLELICLIIILEKIFKISHINCLIIVHNIFNKQFTQINPKENLYYFIFVVKQNFILGVHSLVFWVYSNFSGLGFTYLFYYLYFWFWVVGLKSKTKN